MKDIYFYDHHNLNENETQPLFFPLESINWKVNKYVPDGEKPGTNCLKLN